MAHELKGVEIFAAGTWQPGNGDGTGITFSEADLDDIVAAFAERGTAGRAPLKLGHNEEQPLTDGQPALGWVTRVWREGGKLLADFSDVPRALYDAIKAGLYKFVSVELSQESGGGDATTTPRWMLDAAALLGADLPAVSTLKDLQSLTMTAARGGLRPAATFALTRAAGEHFNQSSRSKAEMDEIAELKAKLAAAEAETVKMRTEAQKERVERKRSEITAQFTAAVDAGRVLPRVQHRFTASRYFTDDAEVLKFTAEDIEREIKDHEVPEAERKATGKGAAQNKQSGDDDARFSALPPDLKVVELREKYAADHHLDLRKEEDFDHATKSVFRRHPEVAKAYFNMPNAAAQTGG